MEKKHIILTGGHSGIGLELTKILLEEGHKIGLIVRSEKRKNDAIKALNNTNDLDFFFADLSKPMELEAVTKEIADKWDQIDALFNNAGVLLDQPYYSERGNEMHFEINTLSVYFLTQKLKPLFDKGRNPVVVNTATGGLNSRSKLDIAELKKPTKFVKLIGSYMYSKFAMTLLMNDLAKEWPQVRIVTVDPGPNKTKMTTGSGMPALLIPLRNIFFSKPTKGAKKLYDGAFSSKFHGKSGVYISGGKIKVLKKELNQDEKRELLEENVPSQS